MGLFLAMAGVVGAKRLPIESALASFAAKKGGAFTPATWGTNEPNTLALLENGINCSVLYPWSFMEWDDASQYLSSELSVPVFSFHIHDEDLWMFVLFDKGEVVTRFNPLPEYWDDSIPSEERESWAGDAAAVTSCVSGVSSDVIQQYLRHWNLDDENRGKAFPDDQFGYCDCWQMCDFLKRLGLTLCCSQPPQPLWLRERWIHRSAYLSVADLYSLGLTRS